MRKPSPGKTATALGAILVTAAMAVPAASADAAAARPATRHIAETQSAKQAALRALCHSSGAIPVTMIPSRVDLATCPIVGRLLVLPIPHERTGPGLYVPRPGHTIVSNSLTTTGSYALTVTNAHGKVIIKTQTPATVMPAPARVPHITREDAACSENGMATEGGVWQTTLNWYYNESTVSRAGLSGSATLSDIRAGNSNMTLGMNNCGWSEQGFNAFGAYQGTTSRYANIDTSGHCTNNFPDGQNTVSWGPFYGNNTLAHTCVWLGGGVITEADIYIGSNVGMVDDVGSPCNGGIDLQSDVTHEWGHAYGLNDLTNSAYSAEVMFGTKYQCQLRRHLGEGDYNGMGLLYFPR